MNDVSSTVRDAQFAYVAAYVRQVDPSATDAAIMRYLAEIETMAIALQSLEIDDIAHVEPFTAEWPAGAGA